MTIHPMISKWVDVRPCYPAPDAVRVQVSAVHNGRLVFDLGHGGFFTVDPSRVQYVLGHPFEVAYLTSYKAALAVSRWLQSYGCDVAFKFERKRPSVPYSVVVVESDGLLALSLLDGHSINIRTGDIDKVIVAPFFVSAPRNLQRLAWGVRS